MPKKPVEPVVSEEPKPKKPNWFKQKHKENWFKAHKKKSTAASTTTEQPPAETAPKKKNWFKEKHKENWFKAHKKKSTAQLLTDFVESAKTKDERDTLLIAKGNVKYRMEDLLHRRRNASLAGQHRTSQRLDKEIMLLRAAMGLKKLPPEEVIRTHTTSRDPVTNENLVVACETASVENDAVWARRITTRNLATLSKMLYDRGYEYTVEKAGALVHHTWKGFNGSQPDRLKVSAIGRDWITAALRNGGRIKAFEFSDASDDIERGIPLQMTASSWNGVLKPNTKQHYANSWTVLLTAMKRR